MFNPSRLVVSATIAATLVAATASAQLIRPDGATATSVFSGSYVVANAINGSGLPANFTPTSPHATYVGGNHWTTRNGETIGQSATFTFLNPQSLGGFYLWAHRSDGVASNPYYVATRFDLVFRDGAGDTIATLTDLTATPGIATAQTLPFPIINNVRSVQYIVRATANNNSSPYTGLAEVAFSPCIAVDALPLDSVSICPGGTAEFTASTFGSGPFTYQWQWQPAGDGTPWENLVEGINASASGDSQIDITGSQAATLRGRPLVGHINFTPHLRYTVTNNCGADTSTEAAITICIGDSDCDADADSDDVVSFFAAWDSGESGGDVDGDGDADSDDIVIFFAAWDAGC